MILWSYELGVQFLLSGNGILLLNTNGSNDLDVQGTKKGLGVYLWNCDPQNCGLTAP